MSICRMVLEPKCEHIRYLTGLNTIRHTDASRDWVLKHRGAVQRPHNEASAQVLINSRAAGTFCIHHVAVDPITGREGRGAKAHAQGNHGSGGDKSHCIRPRLTSRGIFCSHQMVYWPTQTGSWMFQSSTYAQPLRTRPST